MPAEQDHGSSENAQMPLPKCNGDGLHILIVEDDPNTAECLALVLRHYGHQVQVAGDGPSACQVSQTSPPDVVLLDLGLPGMDGWEIARRFRELSLEKMPFLIALTGHGREEDRRRSLKAGIDLHLVKPLDPESLRQTLERFYRIIKPG